MSEESRITANPLSKESRFWKWNRWVSFILFLAVVSIQVATFRQQARNRQLLSEIQRKQVEIQRKDAELKALKKESDRLEKELKKEADRLKKELGERS